MENNNERNRETYIIWRIRDEITTGVNKTKSTNTIITLVMTNVVFKYVD